tara:strand:- start:55197 stop:56279 length:1083 start_codon:yes stop_codon:yes gene_type:complete
MILKRALFGLVFWGLISPWSIVYAAKYDVLALPAVPSEKAAKSLIMSIKKVGDRYFAVGHRGHILYSDDGGTTWEQGEVPVRSTLLDIDFPTPDQGWVVGHEGVILHSADGGKTWTKQYDGVRYGQEGLAYYSRLAEENPDNELYPYLVEEMEFAITQGADKPLFRVHFQDEKFGHALGAYGMILVTRDGGETWQHALHTTENDAFYHVFDFAPLPEKGRYFLSGEAGLFMVGDINESTSKKINSVPWEGSFFTSSDTNDGAIVMGGLRGRMFRTEDVGDTWTVVEKPPTSSIVDSVKLSNGDLIFVGIAGEVLRSTDNGNSFAQLPVTSGDRIYAVAEGPTGTILAGGPKGITKLELPQ